MKTPYLVLAIVGLTIPALFVPVYALEHPDNLMFITNPAKTLEPIAKPLGRAKKGMTRLSLLVLMAALSSVPALGAEDASALFLSTPWATVSDPARVDPAVMKSLTDRFGDDKRLAGPGEPFDATDLVSGRPTRRFLVAGRASGRWFVAYEHGGRGHHVDLAMFDTSGATVKLQFLASGSPGIHDDVSGWRVSLDDLRAAVKNGRLTAGDSSEHD